MPIANGQLAVAQDRTIAGTLFSLVRIISLIVFIHSSTVNPPIPYLEAT